jgi:hypothetical protein
MSVPFVVCALITAVSSIVSFGFFGRGDPQHCRRSQDDGALRLRAKRGAGVGRRGVFSDWLDTWLLAIASCMIIVQAGDATIVALIRDRVKTFGPAGTAVVNLAAMIWLLR